MHPLVRHEPDLDNPGWWTWAVDDATRYAATLGKLIVRADGPGRGVARMIPDARHRNIGEAVHGGAILTFIDMAMFAGGHMAGAEVMEAVTLDLATQFISAGTLGTPLDAQVELLRETGRLAFLRGTVEQDGRIVAAWSGTLRKAGRPR